jgi:Domain of unknown function (DUF4394)/Calx-beta domain
MRVRFVVASVSFVAACGGTTEPDPEPGQSSITIEARRPSVPESGTFELIAKRLGDPAGAASVEYRTVDAGATANVDYEAATGTLAWEDGDNADKLLTIRVMGDLMLEGAESLTLTAGEAVGASPFAPVSLEIRDDDRLGDAVALTSSGRIVSFDREKPGALLHSVRLAGLLPDEEILGIDVRPRDGSLYALTSRARLYTIDAATGQATRRADLTADPGDATAPFTALAGDRFGIDWNPVADRLRVVSDTGQNLRIDVETGRTFTDGAITGGAAGLTAAGYTGNFAAACRTRLYAIDTTTDRLLLQDPPNDGATAAVGAGLGVNASAALLDMSTDASGVTQARALLTVGGATALYSIDLAGGGASKVGQNLELAIGEAVRGFALALPAPTEIPQQPGELYAVTESHRLLSLNRGAPAKPCTNAPIGGLAAGDQIVGIDVRPSTGILYALANNAGQGKLYRLDPVTGTASAPVVLSQPLSGTAFGMDWNPTGPVALRIVSDTGQNLRVTDVATGATIADGAINGATGLHGAAYTNSVQGAAATTLYTIDTAADRLRIQTPPNDGTQVDVGALGVDVSGVAGFEIDGRDNLAFAALDLAGGTGTTLHTVNLGTGAVSASLGTVGGSERLRGLARPTPTTTVFGLLGGNQLVTIPLANPAAPAVVGAVSGLAAGESLLGIDFRPSTGILYGFGSAGRLYAIDPATAAGTLVSTLAADAADTTSPFAGLAGDELGLDFNPTGPVALRIVSDAEQNLRIPNVATGATVTDTQLASPLGAADVVAAAYTNSFPGSTATQLLVIDTAANQLMLQAPPNDGVLAPIGALSQTLTFSGPAAFDIAGGANGISLAALRRTGEVTSRLYRIDLVTGAATEVGTGIGGGAAVRGLAIRIR